MDQPDVLRRAAVADRLGRAFAVWRLRPDDPGQEAFLTACGRLADTVDGGVTLGVHGARFVVGEDETVATRAAGALAEALYRLGIERLRVHRAPDPTELLGFFVSVDAAADREDLHHRLGAVAGVLEPLSIAPTAARAGEQQETEGWREIWDGLADPDATAREIGGDGSPDGGTIIERMIALRGELPEEQQRSPELAERLNAALLRLPPELRTAVARELTAAPDAAFSGWLLSSLTDHELGQLLDGASSDVVGLARRALGRDLRDLADGVEIAPPSPTAPADDDEAPVRVLAGGPMAMDSLELFLCIEHRPPRVRAALLHWQDRVRDALVRDDLDTVHDLLGLGHRVVAVAEHDLTAALDAAAEAVLGPEETRALLPPVGEALPDRTLDVLRAFGPVAIDALLGRLVVEEDAQRRSQLVGILAAIIPGNTGALARWLDDPRWFVVRNVVTALWRAAEPASTPLLAEAARHPEPRVRIETARAFAALGHAEGLAALAADGDADVRRSARRLLTGLGSPAAAAALATLVRDDAVPLADRRSTVDALADHPHGASHLQELADDRALPLRIRWHAGRFAGGAA